MLKKTIKDAVAFPLRITMLILCPLFFFDLYFYISSLTKWDVIILLQINYSNSDSEVPTKLHYGCNHTQIHGNFVSMFRPLTHFKQVKYTT